MTITNFNYEGSYLPGVICNIVVKADLGRSTSQMHHGIYIMGFIWQSFWIIQEKAGNIVVKAHFSRPTPHMTITNFNYEGSYLPGVICNIVVKADRDTSTPQMHHRIYMMGCIWQPFWILQEKVGISFYFWIIRLVNSQLALYSHVRWNLPQHPQNTPTWQW